MTKSERGQRVRWESRSGDLVRGGGGEASLEITTRWGEGYGPLLSMEATPLPGSAIFAFMILDNLFPYLDLLITPHSGANSILNSIRLN